MLLCTKASATPWALLELLVGLRWTVASERGVVPVVAVPGGRWSRRWSVPRRPDGGAPWSCGVSSSRGEDEHDDHDEDDDESPDPQTRRPRDAEQMRAAARGLRSAGRRTRPLAAGGSDLVRRTRRRASADAAAARRAHLAHRVKSGIDVGLLGLGRRRIGRRRDLGQWRAGDRSQLGAITRAHARSPASCASRWRDLLGDARGQLPEHVIGDERAALGAGRRVGSQGVKSGQRTLAHPRPVDREQRAISS